MIQYPLSPATSVCDSLASDELDELLEAQGELSRWPTPPISVCSGQDKSASWSMEDDEQSYQQIASFLSNGSNVETESASDVEVIAKILLRAQLPPEVVAVAFNIISGLRLKCLSRESACLAGPGDLLVASVLRLAMLYTIDNPPSFASWAGQVCDYKWTTAQIDKTVLHILTHLDWHLHPFSSPGAIREAMAKLYTPEISNLRSNAGSTEEAWDFLSRAEERYAGKPAQLKVTIDDRSTCWLNGQITPEVTPTDQVFEYDWKAMPNVSIVEVESTLSLID